MAKPSHINLICRVKVAELSPLPSGFIDAYRVTKFGSIP